MEQRSTVYGSPGEVKTAFIVVLLVVAAYFSGTLWTRLHYLKGNSVPVVANNLPAPASAAVKDKLKALAKQLKLNEKKFSSCLDSKDIATKIQRDVQLSTTVGADGTPSFFIQKQPVVGAQPWDIFDTTIQSKLSGKAVAAAGGVQPAAELSDAQWEQILKNPVATLGDAKAPVKMVEFTDFQCPFCKRAFDETFPKIKSTYIDTGKVYYIVHDLPLTIHPNAPIGAQAARCAADQGKYWEMHDLLFKEQQNWSV